MIYTLENKFIRFSVDENARLVELINLQTGHNYAGKYTIWQIVLQVKDDLEVEVACNKCIPEISCTTTTMRLRYDELYTGDCNVDCELVIDIELMDDELVGEVNIKNHDNDIVVRECHFPVIGNIQKKDEQCFIWSNLGGEKYDNITAEIKKYHTQYKICDQCGIQMGSMYPGTYAALNCFLFADKYEGLYFGSHDISFQNTLHLLKLHNDTSIIASFVKYPYLSAGESVRIKGYVISPYSGTWHYAAKKYRKWLESWMEYQYPPEWVKKLNGWQRIILKHQYGKIHYKYDELMQIFNDGMQVGINSVFLFGWTEAGHDNGYPEYEYDMEQGGEEKLKHEVARVQENGGHVILYFNGRLIDTKTEFFQSSGGKLCIHDSDGYCALEQYPFSGTGTASRWFGSKTFAIACPATKEWNDVLEDCMEKTLALGADSIFFDQFGITEKICHSNCHGHDLPCKNPIIYKARALKLLREMVKKNNPQMAIGIEALSDITAQYADFVHGLSGGCTSFNGDKPVGYIDIFRYVFPEVVVSDREIRDDFDIERRVNHAVLKGLRSDIEIYRCRKTISEAPRYETYLKKINSFRNKYAKFLLEGIYCDTENFFITNSDTIEARLFENGNQRAVIMTQSTVNKIEAKLSVPNYHYLKLDSIGNVRIDKIDKTEPVVILDKNAIAIVIFEK